MQDIRTNRERFLSLWPEVIRDNPTTDRFILARLLMAAIKRFGNDTL